MKITVSKHVPVYALGNTNVSRMNGQRYRKYYLQLWFDEYTE
jgi:hypothetical protein